MIFHDFFNKNFHFKISLWCSGLPEKLCLTVIVLYCCLNRFVPLCFSNLTMQLTIASWGAFLLVGAFLYFSKYKISDICSFRYIESGSAYKVIAAEFLIILLTFICYYWSCEFFKYIGFAVSEEQPLVETLKDASVSEKTIIGITTIIIAPVGEEIVFRRMLYGLLIPLGSAKALIYTSLLFSICHFYIVGIPGLFFLAMILQLLYLNTKNLWCPIQVHMIYNTLSFIALLCSPK